MQELDKNCNCSFEKVQVEVQQDLTSEAPKVSSWQVEVQVVLSMSSTIGELLANGSPSDSS